MLSDSEYPSLAEVYGTDPAVTDALDAQLAAARLKYVPGDYRVATAREQQQSDTAAAPMQSKANTAPIKLDQGLPLPKSPLIAAYNTSMPAAGVLPVGPPVSGHRSISLAVACGNPRTGVIAAISHKSYHATNACRYICQKQDGEPCAQGRPGLEASLSRQVPACTATEALLYGQCIQ